MPSTSPDPLTKPFEDHAAFDTVIEQPDALSAPSTTSTNSLRNQTERSSTPEQEDDPTGAPNSLTSGPVSRRCLRNSTVSPGMRVSNHVDVEIGAFPLLPSRPEDGEDDDAWAEHFGRQVADMSTKARITGTLPRRAISRRQGSTSTCRPGGTICSRWTALRRRWP